MRVPQTPGFGASLLFAALAALAWPLVAAVLGRVIGVERALPLHLATCAGLYALRFAPPRLRALRRRPARALALELAFAAGGLALARLAFGPGSAGTALAIWAFGLVQSAWLLVGGVGASEARGLDPFDEARRRAEALLDEEP